MIRKLKKRLVLLYGITSSIVITVILTSVIIINWKENNEQALVLFQKNAEQIIEKIRSDNIINNGWMLKMEVENHLFVIVEENGKMLTNVNHPALPASYEQLLLILKNKAEAEGIFLDRKPLSNKLEKTSVLKLQKSSFHSKLGMVAKLPKNETGWLNIMLFYYNTDRNLAMIKQLVIIAALEILGVAAMFIISSLYINKVLAPLEEGQQKQNAFIAAASHELRSPLTIIKAGIASIREDITRAQQFLPHMEGECDRMARLINDMLLLAAADTKSWELHWEQVDMDTLMIECYDMFCTCQNPKHGVITLDLPEEKLCRIHGDKERLKQIMTILVDNAMNHISEGGRITLRLLRERRSLVIEVEDNGDGIPDPDKNHIFERFFRGDQSREDKKHYGLGLSIAKELVELHQGSILVRDTPGGGATFVLQLPE